MTAPSPPVIAPVLGNLIKLARIDKRLTQDELGEALDVRQSTVSMWETGKQRPRVHQLGPLAAALGISRDALLAAVDSETS